MRTKPRISGSRGDCTFSTIEHTTKVRISKISKGVNCSDKQRVMCLGKKVSTTPGIACLCLQCIIDGPRVPLT